VGLSTITPASVALGYRNSGGKSWGKGAFLVALEDQFCALGSAEKVRSNPARSHPNMPPTNTVPARVTVQTRIKRQWIIFVYQIKGVTDQ
jgi:hypothetical protein